MNLEETLKAAEYDLKGAKELKSDSESTKRYKEYAESLTKHLRELKEIKDKKDISSQDVEPSDKGLIQLMEETLEQVCNEICNNYCKKPEEREKEHGIKTDEEYTSFIETVCEKCPLNKLR